MPRREPAPTSGWYAHGVIVALLAVATAAFMYAVLHPPPPPSGLVPDGRGADLFVGLVVPFLGALWLAYAIVTTAIVAFVRRTAAAVVVCHLATAAVFALFVFSR